MELNIDLLETRRKKSLPRIILGVLCLLLASGWLATSTVLNRLFDWLYFSAFALNGIVHIVNGLGYSFDSFFGKAYVLIDSEIISIKKSAYEKEKSVRWSEIKSIFYSHAVFNIAKTNGTTVKIHISSISFALIKEIRKTISNIAREKNIQCNLKD
jgi:hypothetical protein